VVRRFLALVRRGGDSLGITRTFFADPLRLCRPSRVWGACLAALLPEQLLP